jgi:hypothetical protein
MILSRVLLGRNHQVPSGLESFCNRFLSQEPIFRRLEIKQNKVFFPTMMCRRHTALLLNHWFAQRKRLAGIISPPEFDKFFTKITEDDNWGVLLKSIRGLLKTR